MDLYVYYRVRSENASELQLRVRAMQAHLSKQVHQEPRLMRRPEVKDGLQTWMEIYVGVSDEFESQLTEAVRNAELVSMIEGGRHTERFIEVLSKDIENV